MKKLLLLTCSLLISGAAIWQPVKAQNLENQISSTDVSAAEAQASGSSGNNSSFAITLIRYEARYLRVQKHVLINWQTINEANNQRFEIERSTDGQSFVKVGTLSGSLNSSSIQYYNFTDTAPLNGKNFYRLKQISIDSSFTFSRQLTVSTRLEGNLIAVTVSPNPCDGGNCEVRVSNPTPGTPTVIELIDQSSRVLLSRDIPANSSPLQLSSQDVAGLKGVYFIRIRSGSETAVQRVFLR